MRPPADSAARLPSAPSSDYETDLPSPRSPAAHFAAPDGFSTYWQFYWAVAAAQLTRWLPRTPSRLLDLCGPDSRNVAKAVTSGHQVVALLPSVERAQALATRTAVATRTAAGESSSRRVPPAQASPPGRLHPVVGDATYLSEFTDNAFDGVIADNTVLSQHLVTEALLNDISRVLRPGGRALLCVDSVVLGMALLAEQDRWPELSHASSADVLLVPWPNGNITRCFTAEELTEALSEAELELEWIKPRTVLSASTIEMMIGSEPHALNRLVEMELKAADTDEYVGVHLLASAVKAA